MRARTYEVRIGGDPSEAALEELERLGVVESIEYEVTTVLSGCFDDVEALSVLLDRLRARGLEVVEIRHTLEPDPPPAGPELWGAAPDRQRGRTA